MLRHRLSLGPVLIAALLGVFWLDQWLDGLRTPGWLAGVFPRETLPPGIALFLMGLAMSPLASYELAKILRANNIEASKRLTWAATLLGLTVSCMVPAEQDAVRAVAIVSSAAAATLVASLAFYSRRRTVEGVVAATGGALLAFVYLGALFGFLLAIRREHSAWMVLGLLLITKSCDIGAFFTGTLIGRRKLIPWLSPGKTWEGLYGGLATATAMGVLGAWLTRVAGVDGGYSWVQGAVMGLALGLAGQTGDLLASLLKRDAGLKDSSRALPGFGGLLDVIDSPLLAAPVAFWLLAAFRSWG